VRRELADKASASFILSQIAAWPEHEIHFPHKAYSAYIQSALAIMKAIIIGAGRGRRLMPTTADTPKCYAEIQGRPRHQPQYQRHSS